MQSSFVSTQRAQHQPLDSHNTTNSRRAPRLAVRNRSRDELSYPVDETDAEIQPAPREEWPTTTLHRVTTKSLPKTEQRHRRHESKDSQGSDRASNARHSSHKKSSGSGMLGFLTLKEPSTSALDQFAEHERKKAAQKGVKSAATVIPGVSLQKLPDHVPKVNTKWDGLPEGAKSKKLDYKDKDQAKRQSTISIDSGSHPQSPRKSHGSMSSKPSGRRSHDRTVKRASVHVAEIAEDWQTESRTVSSLESPSGVHPALRGSNQPTSYSYSPSLRHLSETPSSPPALEYDSPEPPPIQDRKYSSGTATSDDVSPKTPAFESTISSDENSVEIRPLSAQYRLSRAFDSSAPLWMDDSEDVIVKTSGPDVLDPPISLRSYRPTSGTYTTNGSRTFDNQAQAPTYTRTIPSNVAPSSGMVRNFSHVSKYYPQSVTSSTTTPSPMQSPANMTAHYNSSSLPHMSRGVVPSSPSEAGYTMTRTPIKKNEVLPWELVEPPSEQPSLTYTTRKAGETGDSSKLKRLSYRLGKK